MQSYYCTAAFQPVRMLGIGWAGQVLALRQPVSSSSHPISSSQPQAHKLQPSSCGRERPPLLIHQPRAAERLGLSASQNQPIRRLIRQPNRAFACVTTKCIDTTKMEENSTKEVVTDMSEHVWFQPVFENSTHRDGAIYENTLLRKEWFGYDFTDRNESKWSKSQTHLPSSYSYFGMKVCYTITGYSYPYPLVCGGFSPIPEPGGL